MNLEKLRARKGFICDMDGVIYLGSQLLPGVREFVSWLNENDKQFLFLTNSSERSPKELQQKLQRMGLDIGEEHFYTSALATAAFLKKQAPGCTAFVIGAPGLLNALYDVGVTMNDVDPDYVIVGETASYNYEVITKAVRLVLNGARLIATNSDLTGPTEFGIAPACRSLVAPIELATGRKAYFMGKPNPLMMRTGPASAGCPLRRGRHGRRPDGHRRHRRHGIRPCHRPRPLRLHEPHRRKRLSLPPDLHSERRGRDRNGIKMTAPRFSKRKTGAFCLLCGALARERPTASRSGPRRRPTRW